MRISSRPRSLAATAFALAAFAGLPWLAHAQPAVRELSTWVHSGSVGNELEVMVRHGGADAPVEGVRLAVEGPPPRFLRNVRISPADAASIPPRQGLRYVVKFDVAEAAPQEQMDTLRLRVSAENGARLDFQNLALTVRFVPPASVGGAAAAAAEGVAVVNVVGLHVYDVEARLNAAGLKPVFVGGNPAPSKVKEYTAESQDPPAGGALVPRGSKVTVRMHAAYIESAVAIVPIVDVVALPMRQAEDRLRGAGLVPQFVGGKAARSRAEEFTVEWQNPAAGAPPVPRGSPVTVAIRSAFVESEAPAVAPARTPPVAPQTSASPPQAPPQAAPQPPRGEDPTCGVYRTSAKITADSGRLEEALSIYRMAAAQGCDVGNAVAQTQNAISQAQDAARRRQQCELLAQQGNQAYGARQFQQALNSYTQARSSGCPGFEGGIAQAQNALAQAQAAERQRQQCTAYAQQGNQAYAARQYQQALNVYTQARSSGCPGFEGGIAQAQNALAQAASRQPSPVQQPAAAPPARPAMNCTCPPGSAPFETVTLLGQSETGCRTARGQVVQASCVPRR